MTLEIIDTPYKKVVLRSAQFTNNINHCKTYGIIERLCDNIGITILNKPSKYLEIEMEAAKTSA